MTLKVIKYLQSNSLEKLNEELGIKSIRHKDYPNLVCLKYNQITSPSTHPIVKECRGIILDQNADWGVVCWSFERFFNYGQAGATNINLETSRIYEKLDGSLMQLYWYDDKWIVATSGTPDASGEVKGFDFTFKDLFWKIWNKLGYKLPNDNNMSYSFELVSQYNHVVVDYKEEDLILIGARKLNTLKEQNPIVIANQNNWKSPKVYSFDSQEEMNEILKTMSGLKQEGFILCDINNYNRVKMKCKDYLIKHKLSSCMSKRNMLNAIRTNESYGVLLHAPQFKELYWKIKFKYEYICGEINGFYSAIKNIDDKKSFAFAAKNEYFSGVLFCLKQGQISNVKEYLADMNIKTLEEWMAPEYSNLEL